VSVPDAVQCAAGHQGNLAADKHLADLAIGPAARLDAKLARAARIAALMQGERHIDGTARGQGQEGSRRAGCAAGGDVLETAVVAPVPALGALGVQQVCVLCASRG
jgi:hypothetical protein